MSCTARNMACPICRSKSAASSVCYDDRYGHPGKFALMRCRECGHAFLKQAFTLEQLTDLYSNYYPRSNFDLDAYQPYQEETGFSAWLDGSESSVFRWVPKNSRVLLDIGLLGVM